jgi:hypothetical protein
LLGGDHLVEVLLLVDVVAQDGVVGLDGPVRGLQRLELLDLVGVVAEVDADERAGDRDQADRDVELSRSRCAPSSSAGGG